MELRSPMDYYISNFVPFSLNSVFQFLLFYFVTLIGLHLIVHERLGYKW